MCGPRHMWRPGANVFRLFGFCVVVWGRTWRLKLAARAVNRRMLNFDRVCRCVCWWSPVSRATRGLRQ
eukprot:1636557-Prymnesium_polylepis.1